MQSSSTRAASVCKASARWLRQLLGGSGAILLPLAPAFAQAEEPTHTQADQGDWSTEEGVNEIVVTARK